MKVKFMDEFEFEAELNGNNIIPEVEVDDDELHEDNLVEVYIDNVKYENMICCNNFKVNGKQHLIIRSLTEKELNDRGFEAKLNYRAMMGDVEL